MLDHVLKIYEPLNAMPISFEAIITMHSHLFHIFGLVRAWLMYAIGDF